MKDDGLTDFGYEKVSPAEKTARVRSVFDSVAGNYDLMNDLMSFGTHRLWKRFAAHVSGVREGASVLDVAGGTADMAILLARRAGPRGSVVLSDINLSMLNEGRDRVLDAGAASIQCVQADAQSLPFADGTFDCVSIAFGLRNVTDKESALRSMYRMLKYGGALVVLEFSRALSPVLARLYETYSFNVIPGLGRLIARDADSYRYLVESIRRHPDQQALARMMEAAGFERVEHFNLSGGIVAVHKGYRI